MSGESIQVQATSTQAPINIQIGEIPKKTIYSDKWMKTNIKNDNDLGNFIKSLFVQHDVVKGLFIPTNTISNTQTRDTDDDNTIATIKDQFAKFFNFKYNIVKNKEKSTIGVSLIKKFKPSKKMKVKDSSQDYLGAKCLSSSKKNLRSPPRKWKIQLICKFKDTQDTRDLLHGMKSNVLNDEYSLILSQEICDDNNGPCSLTKEPSNEILQYYNNIIKNTEDLLKDKDTTKLGTFLPKIIDEITLVVEGVPSVADMIVKLLSLSTFDKCEKTELNRILSLVNLTNVTQDTPDTPDDKAKTIILLSLYDANVKSETIQEISDLIIPINQYDIMAITRNYIQQITNNNSIDQNIKELVKEIPTRIQEYQTNSSCQSRINEDLTKFNKSVSNNTTVVNDFLSTNSQKVKDALGQGLETIKEKTPEFVKDPIKKMVENIIPTNTNRDGHDNFVRSILALLNTPTSDENEQEKEENEDDEQEKEEEKEENKDDEQEKEESFGELVLSTNNENDKEEREEQFGELVLGTNNENTKENDKEEREEQFGELVLGKNNENTKENDKEEEKEEQFGELVFGKNNDLIERDFIGISSKCKPTFRTNLFDYSASKRRLWSKYDNYKTTNTPIIKLKKVIEAVVRKLYGIHSFSLNGNLRESCDAFPDWNKEHEQWFQQEKNEIQPIIDEYNLYLKQHPKEGETLEINHFKFNGGKNNQHLEIGQNDIEYGTI